MKSGSSTLDRAVELIARLPGIGRKTAQRLAFFIVNQEDRYVYDLAEAIAHLKSQLNTCPSCFNFCHGLSCAICGAANRDTSLLCVVEDANSLSQIERSGAFKGLYHVLQGALSPVHGMGPEALRIEELLSRLVHLPAREIILATNPTLEGEATAIYLAELLRGKGLLLSRIAMGIPMGGSLDFVDELTMAAAMGNRRPLG
jgi:recombination protein RecR